jgi:hypothetical protein
LKASAAAGKYLMNNVTSGRVGRTDVTLAAGAQMLRNCTNMIFENGTVGPAGYLVAGGCSNIAFKDIQFNGEQVGSFASKLSFENFTAVASVALFNAAAANDTHSAINSTLNGVYYGIGMTGTSFGSAMHIGVGFIWVDAAGKLRIKSSAPTTDLDGVVVGTQT